MNYAQIRDMDVVNGIGIAVSLFVSGCNHRCYNCFNKEAWDFNYGKPLTEDVLNKFIGLSKRDYIDCISILGGDLLCQEESEIIMLLHKLHKVGKPIYVWTGFTIEQVKSIMPLVYETLVWCGVYLIDGKYVEEKRDTTLKLRGSLNQRVWDMHGEPKDITKEIDNGVE